MLPIKAVTKTEAPPCYTLGRTAPSEMSEPTSTADHGQTREGKIRLITSSEKGEVISVRQNRAWGDKKIRSAS